MPPTTANSFGDVVLVPFPFTDQTGTKKRPAVVVSSADYQAHRRDLVIMAITSQIRPRVAFGEFTVAEWRKAGLIAPSAVKPVLTTHRKAPRPQEARPAPAGGRQVPAHQPQPDRRLIRA
jgi:mRNA interferase MazF